MIEGDSERFLLMERCPGCASELVTDDEQATLIAAQ